MSSGAKIITTIVSRYSTWKNASSLSRRVETTIFSAPSNFAFAARLKPLLTARSSTASEGFVPVPLSISRAPSLHLLEARPSISSEKLVRGARVRILLRTLQDEQDGDRVQALRECVAAIVEHKTRYCGQHQRYDQEVTHNLGEADEHAHQLPL
jgi:hypothetical protein